MAKIYQGDVGISVTVATGVVLTGATVTNLKVKKPSGTIVTWLATINGTNNQQLDYTTIAIDLNEQGDYYLQSSVSLGTQVLLGETVKFPVYAPFQ
jgi:hypothetical protein